MLALLSEDENLRGEDVETTVRHIYPIYFNDAARGATALDDLHIPASLTPVESVTFSIFVITPTTLSLFLPASQ